MSQIVDAIDAELKVVNDRIQSLRDEFDEVNLRASELLKLREGAVALNGGPPAAAPKPKPAATKPKQRKPRATKPKASPPATDRQEPSPQTTEERAGRRVETMERDKRVLDFVRERGEVKVGDVAELLGVSEFTARDVLNSLAAFGKTGLRKYPGERGPQGGRPPMVYRLEIAPTNGEGAKTKVEQRVVDAVREGQPIDEGTLAFHASISVNDLRSVATGLVRRGVLTCRREEDVKLYEVAPAA